MRKLMARNVKGERKNKNVKKGIKMMEMRAARRHGQPIIIIIHHSCSVMGALSIFNKIVYKTPVDAKRREIKLIPIIFD